MICVAHIIVAVAEMMVLVATGSMLASTGAVATNTIALLALGAAANRIVDLVAAAVLHRRAMLEGASSLSPTLLPTLALSLMEVLSTTFRSISLGVRFAANGSAGHILIDILVYALLTPSLSSTLLWYAVIPAYLFEYSVASVQVGVFSVLMLTYTGL